MIRVTLVRLVTEIDDLVRVGLLKDEQRQNSESLQAVVLGLVYRLSEDAA